VQHENATTVNNLPTVGKGMVWQ